MLDKQGWLANVPYFTQGSHHILLDKVLEIRKQGTIVYPPQNDIFKAFELTSWDSVKIVIVGQDPYHGRSQAHGLSFSVQANMAMPPSLRNIFQEIANDFNLQNYSVSPCLERWATQGILLLNTVLTVEAGKAQSHKDLGWQELTHAVFESLGQREKPLAVLLWGNSAKQFKPLFMQDKHLVLTASHPSPFSANTGFFGCKHFSKVNDWLMTQDLPAIIW